MIDKNLKYLESHEWAKLESDGTVTVGISDIAYSQLGDIVFIELPAPGLAVVQNQSFGVIESVKAASDIFAPVSGEIIEVNKPLEEAVDTLADDAYGNWMVKIKPANPAEYDALLDAEKYAQIAEHD